jgi:hypothetical protein
MDWLSHDLVSYSKIRTGWYEISATASSERMILESGMLSERVVMLILRKWW